VPSNSYYRFSGFIVTKYFYIGGLPIIWFSITVRDNNMY
jgi:hypothetical protein